MEEIWKPVPNYENIYMVSNLGNMKSLKKTVMGVHGCKRVLPEFIMKPWVNVYGYILVNICKDGTKKTIQVHQLVAMAFLGHVPDGHKVVVNHINLNKQDNRVENLELVSNRENCSKKHLPSSSKYTGVSWSKRYNVWMANIMINGNRKHLGRFKCELAAAKSYWDALCEFNGHNLSKV